PGVFACLVSQKTGQTQVTKLKHNHFARCSASKKRAGLKPLRSDERPAARKLLGGKKLPRNSSAQQKTPTGRMTRGLSMALPRLSTRRISSGRSISRAPKQVGAGCSLRWE